MKCFRLCRPGKRLDLEGAALDAAGRARGVTIECRLEVQLMLAERKRKKGGGRVIYTAAVGRVVELRQGFDRDLGAVGEILGVRVHGRTTDIAGDLEVLDPGGVGVRTKWRDQGEGGDHEGLHELGMHTILGPEKRAVDRTKIAVAKHELGDGLTDWPVALGDRHTGLHEELTRSGSEFPVEPNGATLWSLLWL